MNFIKTEIPEVVIIEPKVFEDSRGYFFESFNESEFEENIGKINFIQDNESKSSKGVLRGLHYQLPPFDQAKLVRVIKGKILDVAVDIRKDSKTFGKYVSVELSEENKRQLFVPRGFAHGFVTLSDEVIFSYKVDNFYSKEHDRGIAFDDPNIGIDWKIDKEKIVLSDKDKVNKNLSEIENEELFERKKKVLVTGSKGQLGKELRGMSFEHDFDFTFTDVDELDITKIGLVEEYLSKGQFDYLINCAAYTGVDKAEEEIEKADLINNMAVSNLASSCKKYGVKLIHISTDFVFDGMSNIPYVENKDCYPLSIYGKTKWRGEQAILEKDSDALIIRTSWFYSSFGNNFVKTILKLCNERDSLGIIFDQVGTPTYAKDLAKAILKIIENKNWRNGIYHYSNEGVAGWYDFAKVILKNQNSDCKIIPIEAKDYPLPARRPRYSILNKAKIKKDFGLDIPYWQDSLEECLKLINESQ